MNTNLLEKTLHTLNVKKHSKPIAICMTALFLVSIVSVLSMQPVQASTTVSPLHVAGTYILDSEGKSVYLRGMGIAGFAPNLILWGQGSTDNWGVQWNTDPALMAQTFDVMKNAWHINMIRVFFYPSWWYRDNIVPAEESSSHTHLTTPISIKEYLKTLATEANKYGIYVDLVPYMLTPSASSFDRDKYATSNFGWQGLPLCGWDEAASRFLADAGYANNEIGFWRWLWSDIATTFKDYPNVIFDAWNEPNLGNDVDPIPQGFLTYLQTMYDAIRSTGSNHLIMMQWRMGWFPNGYGNTLNWVKQIADAIPDATNLVYTTHLYYYAPTDLTSYWATDYEGIKAQLQEGISTMGVTAPLVVNEEGSCLAYSSNRQRDVTWWTNLLRAQYDLGIGAGAYYWLSDAGLGPIYAGETMLTSGYQPNAMGQAYIDAYRPGSVQVETPAPTPATPAPTETPAPTPTEIAIPAPTEAPVETPAATPEPTQTPAEEPVTPTLPHVPSRPPIPIPTAAPTETPEPTVTPTEEPAPTEQATPEPTPERAVDVVNGFFYRNWLLFFWPRFNSWFAIRLW